MGWNTTVLVMNDALGNIEADKDFGAKLAQAIYALSTSDKGIDVSAVKGGSIHVNAATVIEQHHAGMTALVAVGGNHATPLLLSGAPHHTEAGEVRLLNELAAKHGYTLRRKRLPAKR